MQNAIYVKLRIDIKILEFLLFFDYYYYDDYVTLMIMIALSRKLFYFFFVHKNIQVLFVTVHLYSVHSMYVLVPYTNLHLSDNITIILIIPMLKSLHLI